VVRILEPPSQGQAAASRWSLARAGAERILRHALQAEVVEYLERHAEPRDAQGHALVVRNGTTRPRGVVLAGELVSIEAPRVNDRRAGERFASRLLPPYVRRLECFDESLPALYARLLATGNLHELLAVLVRARGQHLSPRATHWLVEAWRLEHETIRKRELGALGPTVVLAACACAGPAAGGPCALVAIGVSAAGGREVLGAAEGDHSSVTSWSALLRALRTRGLAAPLLGAGARELGFWGAVPEVWPETSAPDTWVPAASTAVLRSGAAGTCHPPAPEHHTARSELPRRT